MTGLPTGFPDLDRLTAGLQPSDLIILAARPSIGKTTFALNIAQQAATEHKIPVVVFSLEMSKEQLAMKLLCSEAGVDMQRMRSGRLKEDDWPRLSRALGVLSEANMFIDDTAEHLRPGGADQGPPDQGRTWPGTDRRRLSPAHAGPRRGWRIGSRKSRRSPVP